MYYREFKTTSAWHQQAATCRPPAHRHVCAGCGLELGAMTPEALGLLVTAHMEVAPGC